MAHAVVRRRAASAEPAQEEPADMHVPVLLPAAVEQDKEEEPERASSCPRVRDRVRVREAVEEFQPSGEPAGTVERNPECPLLLPARRRELADRLALPPSAELPFSVVFAHYRSPCSLCCNVTEDT